MVKNDTVIRICMVIFFYFVFAALFWPFIKFAGFGYLPGDIFVFYKGMRIYLPFTSGAIFCFTLGVAIWVFIRK